MNFLFVNDLISPHSSWCRPSTKTKDHPCTLLERKGSLRGFPLLTLPKATLCGRCGAIGASSLPSLTLCMIKTFVLNRGVGNCVQFSAELVKQW